MFFPSLVCMVLKRMSSMGIVGFVANGLVENGFVETALECE